MFKKIEIWILYLVVLIGLLFTVGFGTLVRQELIGGIKAGWLSKASLAIATLPLDAKAVFKLIIGTESAVEDRFPTQSDFEGKPNIEKSYLLLSRFDGNLKEGIVELVDLMNFEVLHTWNPDFDQFNSLVKQENDFRYLSRDGNNSRRKLTSPKLTKDNGLIFTNGPLIKIDSCANLIFQNTEDFFHHSIETDIDNNIWAPSHMYPYALPINIVGTDPLRFKDDAIVKVSPDGQILYEKSVAEIFVDNHLEYLLFSVGFPGFNSDPIHLNDIQPVDFDGKYWKKGDIFLSLRHQSMILLYRPKTNKIIWKATGRFMHQHDVDILDDHRISVFNNNSKDFINGDKVDGYNEVVIYDFKKNEYSYHLKESLIQHKVRTITGGKNQILDNDDLFIEEVNYGRILYFDADGSLRWSYVNRAEDQKVYGLGWSRILYKSEDIKTVSRFLASKGTCND